MKSIESMRMHEVEYEVIWRALSQWECMRLNMKLHEEQEVYEIEW